jgi:hypothetical protein
VYSVALEEWDRKAKLLFERVHKMEKQGGNLTPKVLRGQILAFVVLGMFL